MNEEITGADIDALWNAPVIRRPLQADRSDERRSLTELATGRIDPLVRLLDRHAAPAWHLAAIVLLDAGAATDVSITTWSKVIDDRPAVTAARMPFRWELLRRTREVALGAATDLTDDHTPPFSFELDTSLLSVGFTELDEEARSALWLSEIERIPGRDATRLLGIPAVAAVTHMVDAGVDLLDHTIQAQQAAAVGRCVSTIERFSDYLDGTLIKTDVDVLHRHLRACDACSHRLDALEDPGGLLADRAVPAPADLTATIAEALGEHLRLASF